MKSSHFSTVSKSEHISTLSPKYIYDLIDRKSVGVFSGSFVVDLPAGGWKVFALSADEVSRLRGRAVLEQGRLYVSGSLHISGDRLWQGALPIRITLESIDGREQSFYTASNNGLFAKEILIADGIVFHKSVRLQEIVTGRKITVQVREREK